MELISVIVPVYKVEKYLDKCVRSIVDQSYRNLEIILVDDGSPDRCGEMCDAWAAKDHRIKVIHKENGGLSDARNAGMAVATGKYMGFIDSDDHIAPDMYRLLLERMTADGSDIAACGVEMVFEDGTPRQMLTREGCCVLDKTQAMKELIGENLLKQPVWYKLYRTELIYDIPFAVGKCHEDVFWSWQAIARAEKVSVFDTPCYFYLQRSGSIMSEQFSRKRLDAMEAECLRHDYLKLHYPALAGQSLRSIYRSCLYLNQLAMRTADKQTQDMVRADSAKIFKKYPLTGETIGILSAKERIWLEMARRNIPLTCRIRNLLGIGT